VTRPTARFVNGEDLESLRRDNNVVLVDLGKLELYARAHIPGALFLDYDRLVAKHGLTGGLVPPIEELAQTLSELGIGNDTLVIACDEEGGGKAARLCWTLDCLGHHRWMVLNGGIHAWLDEKRPLSRAAPRPLRRDFIPRLREQYIADADLILEHLGRPGVALLDARSPEEFSGAQRFARRAGHIPGAMNWEWTDALDANRKLRLRPDHELFAELTARNVVPEREVICYCQTHHRSSLTYAILRHLGYEHVRGYPGSWSDWGNRMDTPIAT
jgi:thiosulfate/3-mercaptopyruvate sulfurtransferase